jgi:hypothetical protein
MKNGRADHDDDPERDPKIARIEDARRRRQLGIGGNGGGKKTSATRGRGGSIGQLLFGVVIVAMAVGLVVSVTRPLWQGAFTFAP